MAPQSRKRINLSSNSSRDPSADGATTTIPQLPHNGIVRETRTEISVDRRGVPQAYEMTERRPASTPKPTDKSYDQKEPIPDTTAMPGIALTKDTAPSLRMSIATVNSNSEQEDDANLDNPLELFEDLDALDHAVDTIAARHELGEKRDILKRAARVERDEIEAFDDPFFPEGERLDLERERGASFWRQSRNLKGAVLIVSTLSGICQGWNQSVLNGSGGDIIEWAGLDIVHKKADLLIYGALSATVPLAAGILSPLIADPLQNHFLGRRGAIAASALVNIFATIGICFAQTLPQIFGCRIIVGATLGPKASVIAPFLAELSPVHLRGALLSTWQITDAFGIFCGFISWKIISDLALSTEARWRILSATTLIPTVPLLLVTYMVPESYIFLMKTRRYLKAAQAACLYRKSDIKGYQDLVSSHFQMEAEGQLMEQRKAAKKTTNKDLENMTPKDRAALDETRPLPERLADGPPGLCPEPVATGKMTSCTHRYHMKEANFFSRLWQVFADARCRRALISSGLVMLTQALCGINAFAFFSSLYLPGGIDPDFGTIFSASFGAVNVLFGLITPFISDRYGRTTLLLFGLPFMTIFMFILSGMFETAKSERTPLVMVFVLLFDAVYSFTVGPAAFSLSAESFPSSVREAGMAVCVFINMTSLGVLLIVYPFITKPLGYTWSLALFGVVDVIATVLCFLFCVDTKDRTLDELQFSFDLPLGLHAKYRVTYVLPQLTRHLMSPKTWKNGFCSLFGIKRNLPEVNSIDSLEDDWRLIPFHRWARLQNPTGKRRSGVRRLLSNQ